MNIWEYEGKQVEIRLFTGKVFTGKVVEYTSKLDNEFSEYKPGIASIAIGDYELYEDEIETITVVAQVKPNNH